jgi:membrane-associated phospholipid phosphatase
MSDPIALNEEDASSVSTTISTEYRPLRAQIARYVSTVLSPSVVSLPAVFLVALHNVSNALLAIGYTCLTLLFISVGPMAYIIVGVKLGKFTDIDVSKRSQRSGPFIFGLLSAFLGLVVLTLTHGPKNLQTVLMLLIISGLLMMVITFWWKISIHASSLAGTVTVLAYLYGNIVLPAYLLVILVGWSRVVLRRHTTTQVLAGSLLSIALALLIMTLRGA